jgi:hypothetical protein
MSLNLDTEIIRDLLDKFREFQVKEEVSFPEVMDDMDPLYVLAEHNEDAVEQEIIAIIDNLRRDQQATLVALMYVGREDFSSEEWNKAFNFALEQMTDHVGAYLLAHPMVSDYIDQGLNSLGLSVPE